MNDADGGEGAPGYDAQCAADESGGAVRHCETSCPGMSVRLTFLLHAFFLMRPIGAVTGVTNPHKKDQKNDVRLLSGTDFAAFLTRFDASKRRKSALVHKMKKLSIEGCYICPALVIYECNPCDMI
ncbi:hypothetical protein RJ527_16440 [Thalassospiraceae bacterium LMO-SO8]|nr:hypothetical protein [Alphaproteobacteria bacterium LMO-S08]WND75611.1 hypothetical protein RJ527_16440 [Thalassospiraceae bacterium LMO-SO8]